MKLLKSVGLALLIATLATPSCQHSGNSKRKIDDAMCPSTAFIEPEKRKGPPPKYDDFKKWAYKGYANELVIRTAYHQLLECWVFYHGEPKKESAPEKK